LRGDFLRQVIDGGAEAAIDDDHVGPFSGEAEGAQQSVTVIADDRPPADGESDVFELLAHIAEVRIDDLARQDFIASANDLDAHAAHPCPSAAITARNISP
jgi:hypothetical protein